MRHGTEDYFFAARGTGSSPRDGTARIPPRISACIRVIRPDGLYIANTRFGMYRWHVQDPVRFESDLKVTIQDLGWRSDGRYLPQQSDVSATAFWYQTEPHAKQPSFTKNDLEII